MAPPPLSFELETSTRVVIAIGVIDHLRTPESDRFPDLLPNAPRALLKARANRGRLRRPVDRRMACRDARCGQLAPPTERRRAFGSGIESDSQAAWPDAQPTWRDMTTARVYPRDYYADAEDSPEQQPIFLLHGDRRDDPNAFLSTIGSRSWRRARPEVTMGALFNTEAQRDKVIQWYGAVERGRETRGPLAAYVDSRRRR